MSQLLDERTYEQALAEFNAGSIRAGLMAKALSESEGDKNRAMAIYLRIRAEAIKEEIGRCGLRVSDRYLFLDSLYESSESIRATKEYVPDNIANMQIHQVLHMFRLGATGKEIAGMLALKGVPCLKSDTVWNEVLIKKIVADFSHR